VEPEDGAIDALADRDIATARTLDAPRELVFTAFSDRNHLMHWWGPRGFTSTFHEFDMRPGGVWRFVLHGPDGANYENESVFIEVAKPERIVFKHVSGPQFEMRITLAEHGRQTRLTWRMLFESAAECNKVKKFAVDATEQNLDRLEARLATMA